MLASHRCRSQTLFPRRNYLYVVHIFQQFSKGVELHQGDHLTAGGSLSLILFIHYRTQRRQFQVAVFLRNTA